MVCDRCVESVRTIFSDSGIRLASVKLGRVETQEELSYSDREEISQKLKSKGFALVLDRESGLTEQVKIGLLEYIRHLEESSEPDKLSVFLSARLHYNYSYLSKIFSERLDETIEGYLIRLKIERVKELLSYRTFTLSEIAWQLKYSSVQYLSNQFRKITGITVTDFLKQDNAERKPLDRV